MSMPKYLQRLSFKCDYCTGDFILGQAIDKWEDADGLIYHIHHLCLPQFELWTKERFESHWNEEKIAEVVTSKY